MTEGQNMLMMTMEYMKWLEEKQSSLPSQSCYLKYVCLTSARYMWCLEDGKCHQKPWGMAVCQSFTLL